MDKILDGKLVANSLKEALKKEINDISEKLKLVVIQVGDDEASNIYINNKRKLCEEMQIDFELQKYEDISEEDLLNQIEFLNNNPKVTSILVQLPLPDYLDSKSIIEKIDYRKDVDGLTSINVGKLYNKEKSILPCTAYGIIKLLEYYNIKLEGKRVTIIGRSNLVGIPLFKLLTDRNCTVSLCHSKTKDLKSYTKDSDIAVVAVGKVGLLTQDMIKEKSILIDVGINRVNGKVVGDITKECLNNCEMMTPVPGGVGPMTVIMLINNIIECYRIQRN